MRFFSLFLLIILSAACGKDSSSGSSNKSTCNLNGRAVACASMQGPDGEGVDLLESMVEVPVTISGSDVVVTAGKTSLSQGRRISCSTTLKSGEVIRFSQSGDSMTLMTSEGNFDMYRKTGGEGIRGTWIWKGYIDQGTHIIRTVTFLPNNRMIMRKTCEL